ncbi:Chorion peroxidase [Amphibalanus amphitrite]|uniref:Chorion peroxidase n=1 Tax=Amphibalanus amphitrite TaxID=1232801 RepID=A0A6A4V0S2_AMPAM|nr:Chorion peroxidase [Amphibalanus amphitrite]
MLQARLVLASFWVRHQAQEGGCDCIPRDQCLADPTPESFTACTTVNGTQGVCCASAAQQRGGPSACSAPILCPSAQWTGASPCSLNDGSDGVVCPPGAGPAEPARRLAGQQQVLSADTASFSGERAVQDASAAAARLAELEARLTPLLQRPVPDGVDLTGLDTAAAGDWSVAQEVGRIGLQRLFTVQAVSNQTETVPETVSTWLDTGEDARRRIPGCVPATEIFCDRSAAAIRTIGGQCNNLEHPFLGRALTGLGRLANATFEDGLYFSPRSLGAEGSPLPAADAVGSLVAAQLHSEPLGDWASTVSEYLSLDLARIAPFRLASGREPDCCSERHPACLPLHVDDRCVSFVRALPASALDCVMRPAAPLSAASSYLDLETLYGSSEEAGRRLRTFRGGRLRADRGLLIGILDQVLDLDYELTVSAEQSPNRPSVPSPDRLNQILLREHNRVADALRRNNPSWEDERVFQSARRVVMSEWQHIIYHEYLPHVLGAAAAAGVTAHTETKAEHPADPTVSVEFALAAFRFWQWPPSEEAIQAAPRVSSSAAFLAMVRGPIGAPPNVTGAELAAVEVLRGREMGLPAYDTVRQLCSGTSLTSWEELGSVFGRAELEALRSIYASPEDVDLWVGGMLERRAPSARVGPTFQCVIADQFRRHRDGDRLFYERSLSDGQLREVRKASLARLLCDNEEGRSRAAPLALEPLTEWNKPTLCTSSAIPQLDLSVF